MPHILRLSILFTLFFTVAPRPTSASCPTPLPTTSLAEFPAESSTLSFAESVFRASNGTTGHYSVVLRYGRLTEGVAAVLIDAAHGFGGENILAWPTANNAFVGLDAVDIGGNGPNRWVTQWNNQRAPDQNRRFTRFATNTFSFSTPVPPLTELWTPLSSYEHQRGSTGLALLPTSRRLVHVASQRQHHGPNACSAVDHFEWRTLMAARESATGAVVPGLEKTFVSNRCSFNVSQTTRGQEHPHVSGSWFIGDWFVVVWNDRSLTQCGVYARVFDASGSPITGDILVDPYPNCTLSIESAPRVAALGSAFVVVWTRGDFQVMLRSFNLVGTPLSAAQPVNAQTLQKLANPDVAITYSDVCGDYRFFFAVTWWGRIGSSAGPWAPQAMLYQNVIDPSPLIPGAGYLPLDSLSQNRVDHLTDRVSVDFFTKFNASDSACADLTAGFSWTVATPTTEARDYLRRRVVRFQPICSTSSSESSPMSLAATESTSTDTVDSQLAGCEEPNCILFYPSTRPSAEPDLLFPEDFQ